VNAENLGQLVELRREAGKQGLDPNVWFGNVERVVSERIGREKVTYVSNIYKYLRAPGRRRGERAARNRKGHHQEWQGQVAAVVARRRGRLMFDVDVVTFIIRRSAIASFMWLSSGTACGIPARL
jgi:membrane-bound lytic murein transglycosylase MltF